MNENKKVWMQDEKFRKCITLAAFDESFFDTLQYD